MTNREGLNLYIGLDDSNHAGKTKGEIIVATFSYSPDDGVVRDFPNSRNSRYACRWLEQPFRDMRFTVLTHEENWNFPANLVVVAPPMIKKFIEDEGIPSKINGINIYLDGRLSRGHRKILETEDFTEYADKVRAEAFIKKTKGRNGFSKGYHCPAPVYVADNLAHDLYAQSVSIEKLLSADNFVGMDAAYLSDRLKKLRAV